MKKVTLTALSILTVGTGVGLYVTDMNQEVTYAATDTYSDEQLNAMNDEDLAKALGYTSIVRVDYEKDKEVAITGTEYNFTMTEDDFFLYVVDSTGNKTIVADIDREKTPTIPQITLFNHPDQSDYASLILVNFGVTPLANSALETGPDYKGVSFVVTPPEVEDKGTVDSNIVTVPEVVVVEDNREELENAVVTPETTLPEGATKVEVPTSTVTNGDNLIAYQTMTEDGTLETDKDATSVASSEVVIPEVKESATIDFAQTGLTGMVFSKVGLALLGIATILGYKIKKNHPKEGIKEFVEVDVENEEVIEKTEAETKEITENE